MTALATDTTTDVPAKTEDETAEAPQFSFRCGNRPFTVWTQPNTDGTEVSVACELGHLPYSAENRERRRNGLMILSAVGMGVSARLILTDMHKISLLASTVIQDAEASKAVVSGAAATGMNMLPLIDLMESCVVPNAPST
jgi:hypothetical protein